MTDLEFSVQQVPVERIFALRKAVLRPYLGEHEEFVLADDLLETTVAFAALTPDDDVIGVARLSPEPLPVAADASPAWRLRAMATQPGVRKRGVGSVILKTTIAYVASQGGGFLWCNARVPAIGLYARAGMNPWGEVWEEPDIGPHIVMWREVEPGGVRTV